MTPPRIAAVGATYHPAGCWSPVNDHRWIADVQRGLFYVVDAFGPTYGGYHAPLGIDPGLAALDAAFDQMHGDAAQRLRHAVQSAHQEMRRLASAHDNGFGHFSGSITACCSCDRNSVAIAQVGGGRAYRCRAGTLELLVPDHMLSTVVATHGKLAGHADLHPGVVMSLLGVCEDLRLDEATISVEAEDAIILCSHSVWSRSGQLVADLCRRRVVDVADVERLVADCATREKHDATMVVIQFS